MTANLHSGLAEPLRIFSHELASIWTQQKIAILTAAKHGSILCLSFSVCSKSLHLRHALCPPNHHLNSLTPVFGLMGDGLSTEKPTTDYPHNTEAHITQLWSWYTQKAFKMYGPTDQIAHKQTKRLNLSKWQGYIPGHHFYQKPVIISHQPRTVVVVVIGF